MREGWEERRNMTKAIGKRRKLRFCGTAVVGNRAVIKKRRERAEGDKLEYYIWWKGAGVADVRGLFGRVAEPRDMVRSGPLVSLVKEAEARVRTEWARVVSLLGSMMGRPGSAIVIVAVLSASSSTSFAALSFGQLLSSTLFWSEWSLIYIHT
jgi:hypothetical protein